jgi:hypothetical protein
MTPPAASAAGRTISRPVAPRHARRVSGPARPRAGARAARRADESLALRIWHTIQTLADSRLLDRMVRSRLWIPVVASMLMGIVFLQVTMLSLNSGIGRAVQRSSDLERQNTTLRAQVSRMESGDRLDAEVTKLGMVQPADGSTHYVGAHRGDAAAATQRMTAPKTPVNAGSVTATATSAAVGATGASAAATTGASTTATAPGTTAAAAPTAAATAVPATSAATPQTTSAAPATATPAAATTANAAPAAGATGAATAAPTTSQTASPAAGGAAAPIAGQR